MAGGTWKIQNKRRPGAYINVVGNGEAVIESVAGRVLMLRDKSLGWGNSGVIELTSGSNFIEKIGTTLEDPDLVALKETLKGAETVLLLNPSAGTPAKLEKDGMPWVITAKYPGEKGNKLTVSVELKPDDPDNLKVTTLFGTSVVDEQIINAHSLGDFTGNDYVTATLATTGDKDTTVSNASGTLTGGTTEGISDLTSMINDALENENYAVVTTAGLDIKSNLNQLLVQSLKRLREDEGRKVRAVIPSDGATNYNYEGVSAVINGYTLNDGSNISAKDATGFFAGISASADAATSLTYYEVTDAISAFPKLDNDKTIKALNDGQVLFTTRPGQRVVIEQDIDTLTKFSGTKPKVFSKNRVMRTLDEIATNTEQVFEQSFLGKVGNNAAGRDLFKANRISYLTDLMNKNIIQDFKNSDITVEKGNDSDSIVVNLAITPVDAMEKLYMTVVVG
ncbi:phage tail sheath family protein [Lactobacillus hominis]|uniref:Putative phage sheath tail protein n=1 Tax=Lactobacillus hominis DSM 23910 = CRBIP 24.179 TaxID=1423758 RepID=I7IVT2_9LACO|nr:phage tail sheath family protein [Lactobacillus hominis]KRM85749.1 Phage related protein [Lactobacillus hominis DSM 23910 = CRBIP 24.179]MCT3347203.1 phage tail protein [Lactobacillus hominis]CCI81988.1 Putative phage sheath tail protein [Lactobacillus hominis DSM 23910 = CRBIP 24.179]